MKNEAYEARLLDGAKTELAQTTAQRLRTLIEKVEASGENGKLAVLQVRNEDFGSRMKEIQENLYSVPDVVKGGGVRGKHAGKTLGRGGRKAAVKAKGRRSN